jgi:hypothetical protein
LCAYLDEIGADQTVAETLFQILQQKGFPLVTWEAISSFSLADYKEVHHTLGNDLEIFFRALLGMDHISFYYLQL